jgi:CHAD domain-containing protein
MPSLNDRAYKLASDERAGAGIRRIALGRADSAIERLREAELAADPAASIHGARKDLKKLRAVMRLLRRELGDDLYRTENRRYRDAGRLLSASRDGEVVLRTLDALGERFPRLITAEAVGDWRAQLEGERERALADARRGATIAVARNAVEAGRARIAGWPLERDSWRLVLPGVERTYRRGRRAMRRATEEPSGERLHEWRKRAKDLWYQLRILEDALPGALADALGEADALADALGDHHDLTVLQANLAAGEPASPPRRLLDEAIERRQRELFAAALERGEALYASRPKSFKRQMRKGWRQWRSRG